MLCVRWYLSFKLSFRDLVAMMNERGVGLAHTTILRWVQHYTPEFEKRWKRYARTIGGSWRMDETYVKVRGEWVYLYRAVDKAGKTVDFYLSEKRDVNAAKAFLPKAMKSQRIPTKITLDAYAASHRAITELKAMGELPKRVRVRTSKYLNNAIEQDHRRIKQRLRPMLLGLKSFQTAAVVIGGMASSWQRRSRRDSSNSAIWSVERQRCRKSGKLPWLPKQNHSQSKVLGRPNQPYLKSAPEPFCLHCFEVSLK